MNGYIKVEIAMTLIIGVIFVMVYAVLEIGRDLAHRYPLPPDIDDDDLDNGVKDVTGPGASRSGR
jgi:hypothetical protein